MLEVLRVEPCLVGSNLIRARETSAEFDASLPVALAVSAIEDTLAVWVNGEEVGQIEDTGVHGGRVGLYIESNAVDASFSDRFEYIRVSVQRDAEVEEPQRSPVAFGSPRSSVNGRDITQLGIRP